VKKIFLIIILVIFLGGGFWYWLRARAENNRTLFSGEQVVEVVDDGISVLGVRTEARTVGDFVEQAGLRLEREDKIYPTKDVRIAGGMKIVVERAIPIKIEVDGETIEKNVFTKNIKDTLEECGVSLNPSDKVEPELIEGIFENIEIVVTRINHKEITEIEDIDFEVVQKKDKKLKWRTEKIKQKGEKGTKEVKYKVTYKNGKEIEREKIGSEITKKPVDEITVVGTKIKVGKKQRGRASWYAYTGKMAAASITFPKGTWLRVTAVNSGKQIFVVVNDYGPAAHTGKILDLDKEAFKKLAPLGAGVIEVKIEEIK
jgi:hypothetical protein